MKLKITFLVGFLMASGAVIAGPPGRNGSAPASLVVTVRANPSDNDSVHCVVLHPAAFSRTFFIIKGVKRSEYPRDRAEKWYVALPAETVRKLEMILAYHRRVKRQVDRGINPLEISDACTVPTIDRCRVGVRKAKQEIAEPVDTGNAGKSPLPATKSGARRS